MLPNLRIWLNHFEYHSQHPRCVPPELPDVLNLRERRLIAKSIATFQLGEQSGGHGLLAAARRFAHARQSPDLERIVESFIREEQRHAALLADFMLDHSIPLKRGDWTDRVFRLLRRPAGFELYLTLLVTAELIGYVYYRALESVTGCQRLKILCRTLVADELAHIGLCSELLKSLRAEKSPAVRTLIRITHKAFFVGVTAVVWLTHRRLLRESGHSARTFLRICRAQYSFHLDSLSNCIIFTRI